MLNGIWLTLVLGSILTAAFNGRIEVVTQASMQSAKEAVELAIGLVGVMAFWLGMMRIAEDGGLTKSIARIVRPVMTRLFPDVPASHPAMSAMILNISSNMMGLANAATPFGIKAMEELNRLNRTSGTATNAMALFLAINTSNVALLPLGVIAIRASLGSARPGAILVTTLIATTCSTLVAIVAAKLLQRLPRYRLIDDPMDNSTGGPIGGEEGQSARQLADGETSGFDKMRLGVSILFVILLAVGSVLTLTRQTGTLSELWTKFFSDWLLLFLIAAILLYGWVKRVKLYESLVEGAKEGFAVALRIIPFLVAILVAVGMFRASGGLDLLISLLRPVTDWIGLPAEALPMALLRPLSGSGAYGVMVETMKNYGPDSLIGTIVSTMQGSTETTFYVLAVYCGAVSVKKLRHTLPACLLADVAGLLASVWVCRWLLG